jgi:hypothetical protein
VGGVGEWGGVNGWGERINGWLSTGFDGGEHSVGGQAVVGELADWAGKVQHRLFQAGAALPESPA